MHHTKKLCHEKIQYRISYDHRNTNWINKGYNAHKKYY